MNIEKAKQIDGWLPEIELQWLAEQAEKSSKTLELGSYMGRSTRALCDNTGGTVIAVDKWKQEGNKLIANFDAVFTAFISNTKDHLMSYKLFFMRMSTNEAIDMLIDKNEKFDFIFIDADHDYEPVRADILGCLRLLSPGGTISGHDYNWEGVKRAVDELLPNHKLMNYIWYERI